MQNAHIQEVKSHKDLGINMSSDCNWHQRIHVNYIKDKAWLRIDIMRKLKFNLDRKSLETIYITFIRSLLNTGTPFGTTAHRQIKMSSIKFRMKLQE